MYIIPSEIERYCKKVGDEIHIEVDLTDKDVTFRFIRGKYEIHGNTAAYLSGMEMIKLLELNGVLGENGKVQGILKSQEYKMDEKIHDLIYNTLAKYVLQMLNAAMGKDYFPELRALPHHVETYFWRKRIQIV